MSDELDRMNDGSEDDTTPEGICTRAFSRCVNWPREKAGILGLAQGLRKAEDATKISMDGIVARCVEISDRCPTDHDLMEAGRYLRDELNRQIEAKRNQKAEWEKQYGPARPYDWQEEAEKILPQSAEHWEKDRKIIALIKDWCAKNNRNPRKMGVGEFMELQVWAQGQLGMGSTPQQRKYAAILPAKVITAEDVEREAQRYRKSKLDESAKAELQEKGELD